MPKKNGNGKTALVPFQKQYPVLAGGAQKAVELIQESLGNAEITPWDLDVVTMPTGGAVFWSVTNEAGDEDTTKELTGVVIFQQRTRAYWIKGEIDNSPPDCSSCDLITGIGDLTGSGERTVHECRPCPFSQWGSCTKGGKGQACKVKNIVFLLRHGEYLPTIIVMPVMSIKVWQKFVLRQAGHGKALTSYEIAISLKEAMSPAGKYSVISVRKTRDLTDDEQSLLLPYAKSLRPLFEAVKKDMSEGDEE